MTNRIYYDISHHPILESFKEIEDSVGFICFAVLSFPLTQAVIDYMNGGDHRTEERLLSFESICREHGLSITPQRVAIYKELISSAEHPSAVTIFNKVREYFSNISLDTVNRTLLTFQKIGLAKIVESSGDPKRFDPNLEPHHHFRCIQCGKIVDFKSESYNGLDVPPELDDKFVVIEKIVHLEGFCDKCRAR